MSENESDSEDRQLEPTERRLQKAREEGQFPQSRDLTTLTLLAVFGAFLALFGHQLLQQMVVLVQGGCALATPTGGKTSCWAGRWGLCCCVCSGWWPC